MSYHYGNTESKVRSIDKHTLVAYIPSLGRGHNIVKELTKNNINFYTEDNDEEVFIYFSPSDIALVATLVKAKVAGATIKPFSEKNLQWNDYTIPEELDNKYKQAIQGMPIAKIGRVYNEFAELNKIDLDRKRKFARLKVKDYIHSIGKFNQLIKFIEQTKEVK